MTGDVTMRRIRPGFVAAFLAISLPALADTADPLALLLGGGLAFAVLQAWIIGSEFAYLHFLYRAVSWRRVLWWTVAINVCSALIGAVVTCVFLGNFLSYVRDRSVHVLLITIVAGYFVSVPIEWAVLWALQRRSERPLAGVRLLGHAFGFNALSYVGFFVLLALVAVGAVR